VSPESSASENAGGGESAAQRIALDALSRSARTRGQLESLLQRKGIAPEAAEAVLDRFEDVGLVDDRGYAEAFVESRHRVRGQGGRALSAQLRQRGVAAEVIAEAVSGLDPDQEFETACRIAQSRYERMPAVAPEVKVRRLAGFLARKGYSGATVSRAVRHVVETADASAADAAEALDGMEGMEGSGITDGGIGSDEDA
jgi:regulatory protein